MIEDALNGANAITKQIRKAPDSPIQVSWKDQRAVRRDAIRSGVYLYSERKRRQDAQLAGLPAASRRGYQEFELPVRTPTARGFVIASGRRTLAPGRPPRRGSQSASPSRPRAGARCRWPTRVGRRAGAPAATACREGRSRLSHSWSPSLTLSPPARIAAMYDVFPIWPFVCAYRAFSIVLSNSRFLRPFPNYEVCRGTGSRRRCPPVLDGLPPSVQRVTLVP